MPDPPNDQMPRTGAGRERKEDTGSSAGAEKG
jgi:hypothetical protein